MLDLKSHLEKTEDDYLNESVISKQSAIGEHSKIKLDENYVKLDYRKSTFIMNYDKEEQIICILN